MTTPYDRTNDSPHALTQLTCERCGTPIQRRRFCSRACFLAVACKPTTISTPANRERAYGRWWSMLDRCTNPDNRNWARYGGRGITVCERWLDFDAYYTDTGDAPAPGLSLDRVDNDADYSPENIRWATAKEQRDNQQKKTHCKYGHPFDGVNLRIGPDGRRTCRTCERAREARRQARRLALGVVREVTAP